MPWQKNLAGNELRTHDLLICVLSFQQHLCMKFEVLRQRSDYLELPTRPDNFGLSDQISLKTTQDPQKIRRQKSSPHPSPLIPSFLGDPSLFFVHLHTWSNMML